MEPLKSATGPAQIGWRRRDRPKYRAARAFYLTVLLGTCLVAFAWFGAARDGRAEQPLRTRDLSGLMSEDEACRLVRSAKDQCAFIKKHCPTDEAGFTAYIDLFYCRIPHLKPIALIILLCWLGLLFSTIGIAASDFFCINLSTMAKTLGMSESMAGVTLLAFGNGSPDVFSTFAAMGTDSGDLAVGELMGAACFITAVVTGSMALIKPFKVSRKSFIRDVGFFSVAAAFTMVILSDGKLHLWECLVMVAYYVFYVAFVVFWHWWVGRRRKKLEREAAARGHYTLPTDGLDEEPESYHDDPDEATPRPGPSRGASMEEFAALERGGAIEEEDDDFEEEERDRWMSELNTNMRLSRPVRSRSSTITPVRPSLVGALEFQSVLKSLQRSRNMQTIALDSRRYSDDPNFTTLQQLSTKGSPSAPFARAAFSPAQPPPLHLDIPMDASARTRAASVDQGSLPRGDAMFRQHGQASIPTDNGTDARVQQMPQASKSRTSGSPSLHLTPPVQSRSAATTPAAISESSNEHQIFPGSEDVFSHRKLLRNLDGPPSSPRSNAAHKSPQLMLPRPPRPRSSTLNSKMRQSPVPEHQAETSPAAVSPLPHLVLPAPVVSSSPDTMSVEHDPDVPEEQSSPKRWRWWPYAVLPPPETLGSVLFPTIAGWNDRGIWEKMLGVVAAPSVFLLTITLPVVESEGESDEAEDESPRITRTPAVEAEQDVSKRDADDSGSPVVGRGQAGNKSGSLLTGGATGLGNAATVATSTEREQRHDFGTLDRPQRPFLGPDSRTSTVSSGALLPDNTRANSAPQPQSPRSQYWPRWLLLTQLYTAPIVVILSIYIQSPTPPAPRWLVLPCLISLLTSTILLIPVLLTTTPTHRPQPYRWMLSVAGFVVSIAWISTIASQVVGALKALAVILNMSHAIMGLTIFAVGNSLSDLVADVTVARLGYPVMALSACFGGPMLNILLGIGLSGTYFILRGASRHEHRHPGQGFLVKSYHIDVGQTLMVSGASLLVTLVGVLVLVPCNRWMLSRRIGVALIVLWLITTIGNVVLEVTGLGDVG